MIFFGVIALTACIISVVAGYFSITGLAAIFPAASHAVMVMGAALEMGKLVSASWVYRFWGKTSVWLRSYLIIAVIILSGITSLGIFGFLSKAHIDGELTRSQTVVSQTINDDKIQRLTTQQRQYQIRLDGLNAVLVSAAGNSSGARRIVGIRQAQAAERRMLDSLSRKTDLQLDSLTQAQSVVLREQQRQNSELGPLVYMAELLYNDENASDKAVRVLILTIMLVFDPLAILLVVAANIQLESLKKKEVVGVDTSFEPDTWFEMVDDPLTNTVLPDTLK